MFGRRPAGGGVAPGDAATGVCGTIRTPPALGSGAGPGAAGLVGGAPASGFRFSALATTGVTPIVAVVGVTGAIRTGRASAIACGVVCMGIFFSIASRRTGPL